MSYSRVPTLHPDRELRAYVVGIALGDGNLSNPNGRATRLRISCDTKYPKLIKKISSALTRLLPQNRVTTVNRPGNCLDISVYSNHLEPLLGWTAGGGAKHKQDVGVPSWVQKRRKFIIPCLRGLIETDGAIYTDRGYPMVSFSTIIPRLARQVHAMISELGFQPKTYKVVQHPPALSFKYQVRLSCDVVRFLRLVRPVKA